jgi:hypothetical protein
MNYLFSTSFQTYPPLSRFTGEGNERSEWEGVPALNCVSPTNKEQRACQDAPRYDLDISRAG